MAVDGFSVLDDYLQHWLGTVPAPGLALSITDHNVTRHTASLGYSDATSGRPVFDDTPFQIGSIGKSMTALALMQLVQAGRLDLNAPLSTHLPWFAPTSRYGPIALKHVMSHTAGLPSGSDFTPASRYEAYALRDVEAAWEPGERFHYSNTGYKMLGWLLEDVARAPYGVIISRRVLQPLGMNATDAVVTHPTRHRMATGHVPLHDDRPYRTGDILIPATWMQYDAGDGSPAATAGDMARYARVWLNGGRSPNRAIVSASSFDRMTSPVIRMSRGDAYENDYGYGFGIISHAVDGHDFIGHGGSTVGFQAIMLIDRNGGLGVTLLCNGNGVDTYAPARYALQVASAVRNGGTVPQPPNLPDPHHVDNAPRYAGTYVDAASGECLLVTAHGDTLHANRTGSNDDLSTAGAVLQHIGGNSFCVPSDAFDPFPLRFQPESGGDSAMAEVYHGSTVYFREGSAPPDAGESHPGDWAALVGHYRSHAPYVSNFRVILRRGHLYIAWPNGGEERITPRLADGRVSGWFTVGAPGEPSAEQVRFDPIVGGKALRVQWIGGGDFYRVG